MPKYRAVIELTTQKPIRFPHEAQLLADMQAQVESLDDGSIAAGYNAAAGKASFIAEGDTMEPKLAALAAWERIRAAACDLQRAYERADLNEVQPEATMQALPKSIDEWIADIDQVIKGWKEKL